MTAIQPSAREAYVPQPKQLEFHAGAGIWRFRAAICGTGAGKTIAGCAEAIRWAEAYPYSVGYIFEPSYPMVRRILLPTLRSKLLLGNPLEGNPKILRFIKGDNRLDFNNGSELWFVSLEDPERAEGPNVDFAYVDEARLVRDFSTAWQVILRRLRGSGRCKCPTGAWVTTTPDSPGSDLFNIFEDPDQKSPQSKVYRWSIYDNFRLPKEFIDEIVRTHSGGLADRFVWGRFATVAGGTLPFDSSIHVREIPRDNIDHMRYGVDIGWSVPSAIVANGLDHEGRAWIVDEFYKTQCSDEDLVEAAQDMQQSWGKGPFFCDARYPQTIDKLRRAGLHAVPYTAKREDGLLELGSRFIIAADRLPRIFISKRCVNLISELLEYDENVKERDHAVDAVRYSLPIRKVGPVTIRRGRVA
jgi:hypothetical protein